MCSKFINMNSKILLISNRLNKQWQRKFAKCSVPDPCKDYKRTIMDPQCKVAIVTGAGSGIGYAVACELLSNGAKSVVVAQKDECRGIEAAQMLSSTFGMNKGIYMPCDVNCPKQFEDVFRNTINQCRRIDILVNNAGILDDKNWCETICTNVTGNLRGNLLAQKYMAKSGGVIVNISGTAGLSPWSNCPVYSASKHAVLAAARCFGDQFHYSKTKIRCMGLCPGFTSTPIWENVLHNHLYDDWGHDTKSCIVSEFLQPAALVGKAAVHIIKYGQTGSVWVCENGLLYRVLLPNPAEVLSSEMS